ncbi:hypothetical protein HPB50_017699 [Hyalomma asiaticum]|uniref:Uncharacterized protein n=1 Tax=Hyalomma asiaticum TaxID=266040 RepID=A0ACB7SFU0_HYAAI|nr:hypothetical protein HPB50_017699 [Hyalomma asiaticum]
MTVVEPHALTFKTPLHNLPAVAMLLLFSSSLINPYLYVIRNKATRKHVRKMFKCLRRKPSFFSPLGYHHSHQSPLQERQCSEGTRVLESSVSLHSGGPEEYQRSLMSRSLHHNSGEWSVVAVTADPNTSRSRRSSLPVRRQSCFDEMEEEPLQLFQYYPSYQHNKNMRVRYNVNVRSSVYRRASLDNGKVPSQRTLRTSEQCVMRTYATDRSPGDRCKSFRIRGRYANRKELTTAFDRSYNTSVNHEERRRYFSDSYQHRRGRDVGHDSRACVSILNRGAEIHRAPLHYANSMARVQRFGSVPSESRSSEASGRTCLPVLVRGRSIAIDEREMGMGIPAQAISQSGSLRKTQFAMGRRSPKQSSSETNNTTLESLTSTESQELPIISSPRTLSPTSITSYRYPHVQTYQQYQRQCWRQQAYSSVPPPTTIPCQQRHRHTEVSQDCQDRRDSGFEDTMLERYDLCCTVEGECSSIRAMKLLEHV